MMLRSLAPLAALLLLLQSPPSFGLPEQPPGAGAAGPRDLSAVIVPLLQKSRLPALGAAIVTTDGLEAIGVAGVRSWTGTENVTIDDRWHLGSCTKAMTATLVARLVDRGVLSWDTKIGDVFGPTVHAAWKDVPMVWLLSHRSGAPGNFSEDLWQEMVARGGSPREQRRFFVERGLRLAPEIRPNTESVYSNAGFLIAGAMVEALTDTSWEDLMRREVFEPLGMTRTGFGAPGTPGLLDQPLGHTRGTDGWSPVALGPGDDNPAATGPAGTIHTTLADWARFVAAHLRGERGDPSYLKPATWQRLHTPGGKDWGYTPGWVVAEQEWAGGQLLRHVGSNNFWLAEATLALRKDFAVLIVTNVSDDAVEAPFKDLLAALVADHAAHVPKEGPMVPQPRPVTSPVTERAE
ncbi:MAG TPA: penicillin-binding protein [Acidobacteria bacterium]|nr:penicillin-binding protein [Acidobacteriota bacterium]